MQITEADSMSSATDLSAIRQIEEGLLANRPALESVVDDAWVWRFANGFTGRANSLQVLDKADDVGFEQRLKTHWQRSLKKGIVPRFRVTPLTPTSIISFLTEKGFARKGNTLVMELSKTLPATFQAQQARILVNSVLDADWQQQIVRLEGITGKEASAFVQLLEKLPKIAVGLSLLGEEGQVIGVAYASCSSGVGSVFALEIAPRNRGKGFGRVLFGQLLDWLIKNGAKSITLQVVADNAAAIGLYLSFGFVEVYKYYYLVAKK